MVAQGAQTLFSLSLGTIDTSDHLEMVVMRIESPCISRSQSVHSSFIGDSFETIHEFYFATIALLIRASVAQKPTAVAIEIARVFQSGTNAMALVA
jgi:hypothetical protein